jgi:hypothetical protein
VVFGADVKNLDLIFGERRSGKKGTQQEGGGPEFAHWHLR